MKVAEIGRIMTSKMFKIVAACSMLFLYLSTMVASNVVALTCHTLNCCCGHSKITAAHSSDCSCHCAEGVDCCHGSEAGDCDHNSLIDNSSYAILQDCGCSCEHDHSNHIELYTQPRSGDDESSSRNGVVFITLCNISSCSEKCEALEKSCSYGVYLLPPLSAAFSSSSSLRAPPALV